MPTESLILRRSHPVPVTFADLRRAYINLWWPHQYNHDPLEWHAAIKEATGAIDEVYAVIDGREVRVATVEGMNGDAVSVGPGARAGDLTALLIAADEQGYWQNPREIVHVLTERPVSFAAVERAVNVGWCAKGGAA
jgi:hypothetical protein